MGGSISEPALGRTLSLHMPRFAALSIAARPYISHEMSSVLGAVTALTPRIITFTSHGTPVKQRTLPVTGVSAGNDLGEPTALKSCAELTAMRLSAFSTA